MERDHYATFIREAFIDPIRSVLIVDDDYPTYDEILTTERRSGKPAANGRGKTWPRQRHRIAGLIATFRRRPRPLLVDIHDGTNVPTAKEVAAATHLHQCDLLVLDYELERDKSGDGTRAIEILRSLMSNNHFNLVVIYTVEDLDVVFDAIRWGLLASSDDRLSDARVNEAKTLIDAGEDEHDGFARDLTASIAAAQYFHSRQNRTTYLRMMGKGQQPYTSYCMQTDRVAWSPQQRKVVLRYLLEQLERESGISDSSENRFNNLEWSPSGLKWIKSDSAFVALSQKTDNHDDLLLDLERALVHWSPRPSRLFLTKLRAEIDEFGVAAQSRVLSNHHALAYWYYRLLLDTEADDRRWRIAESVSRHSGQLLETIQPRVEDFASRLIQAETASGAPLDICKEHFRVNLDNEAEQVKAALEHNAFVCSADPTGWHLTTGHVFCMDDAHWMCLSPACDMVPSQLRPWQVKAFGDRIPFIGIQLQPIKTTKIPGDIDSNRYVFIHLGKAVSGYCFNDPSDKASAPKWQLLFGENRGKFSEGTFRFKVTYIEPGKTRLVSRRLPANVISQVRYEYALNLMQKLGASLTRVGLDFSAGAEANA